MQISALPFEGVFEITLSPKGDERGYFCRTLDTKIFQEHGLVTEWAQENEAYSISAHTIRGLHFQRPPFAETKLVRVVHGVAWDAFVDLRKGSDTFGKWGSVELSSENGKMLYLPKGFAHGYCTMTPNVKILYRVDARYAPEHEGGLRWDDPDLGIRWPAGEAILSAKDRSWPVWSGFSTPFI